MPYPPVRYIDAVQIEHQGQTLILQPKGQDHWAEEIVTPLGLVPEGGDVFTLLYTGCNNCWTTADPSYLPDNRRDSIGLTTLKLVRR